MSISEELAKFITGVNYENIPVNVLVQAKNCIIDCLGTMLAGSKEQAAEIIVKYLHEMGGNPAASVVGRGFKTSVYHAAMANGTTGHILDYDDMSSSLIGHPTVSVLPAVLALGEERKLSGKDLLVSFVLGIEVECKLGRGTVPRHYENGWHPTSTIGIFGATAAASKLTGLAEAKIINAFGIAGSESSGLRENFGTMTKAFHSGRAAAKGVMAALLANQGFSGAKDIFEGEWGFCKVMVGDYEPEKITGELGNPFELEFPGLTVKPYPTCGATHPAIDAVIFLAKNYNIKAEDIEKIECKTMPIAKDVLVYPRPKTGLEGKFSMPFCLALALIEKNVALAHFTTEKVMAPEIKQIMERVEMDIAPEFAELGYRGTFNAIVKIQLKDGQEYIKKVDHARGDPTNPLSQQELINKYSDCAVLVLTPEKIKRSLELLVNFENIPDLTALMDILRN